MEAYQVQLLRKVLRSIKILNFVLIFFALVFLTVFVVGGIFAYKAVQEIRAAKSSLDSVQSKASDTLNVRDQLCSNTSSLGSLVKNQSDICK